LAIARKLYRMSSHNEVIDAPPIPLHDSKHVPAHSMVHGKRMIAHDLGALTGPYPIPGRAIVGHAVAKPNIRFSLAEPRVKNFRPGRL
jgi:hypothetical protein